MWLKKAVKKFFHVSFVVVVVVVVVVAVANIANYCRKKVEVKP